MQGTIADFLLGSILGITMTDKTDKEKLEEIRKICLDYYNTILPEEIKK